MQKSATVAVTEAGRGLNGRMARTIPEKPLGSCNARLDSHTQHYLSVSFYLYFIKKISLLSEENSVEYFRIIG